MEMSDKFENYVLHADKSREVPCKPREESVAVDVFHSPRVDPG